MNEDLGLIMMCEQRIEDANRVCVGFERDVPMASKLHPVTLYHVSVNKNAVCNEGLKSNIEIKPGKFVQGIGGLQYREIYTIV